MSDDELKMPFVCVQSVGGEYEDVAFVAGFRCGMINTMLGSPMVSSLETFATAGLLAQLDLVAMAHGFSMQATEQNPDWVAVRFVKV